MLACTPVLRCVFTVHSARSKVSILCCSNGLLNTLSVHTRSPLCLQPIHAFGVRGYFFHLSQPLLFLCLSWRICLRFITQNHTLYLPSSQISNRALFFQAVHMQSVFFTFSLDRMSSLQAVVVLAVLTCFTFSLVLISVFALLYKVYYWRPLICANLSRRQLLPLPGIKHLLIVFYHDLFELQVSSFHCHRNSASVSHRT